MANPETESMVSDSEVRILSAELVYTLEFHEKYAEITCFLWFFPSSYFKTVELI